MDAQNGAGASNSSSSAEAARRVKEAANAAMHQGKEAAAKQLRAGAEKVNGAAHGVTSALRRAADDVEGENSWISGALRKSAEAVEGAANAVATGDLNQAVTEVGAFARRHPALFVGASVALGFALARIGKTALEANADTYSSTPEGGTYGMQSEI